MALQLRFALGLVALCASCASTAQPHTAAYTDTPPAVRPFLLFQNGEASAALDLYRAVFPSFRELTMERYGPDAPGPEGTVFRGEVEIGGQRILLTDSIAPHAFGFTPSISFWIECADAEELDRTYNALVEGGAALMPPADYGFAPRFAWVADRFGITWQLHVAAR